MAFGGFKSLGEVALKYQITLRAEEFILPQPMTIDPAFRQRLEFDLVNGPVTVSEFSICEFIIAPILQEMWRTYHTSLTLWSHVFFGRAAPLQGFPDYFFSRCSRLGARVMDQPYLLFAEAKGDNFDMGWGQCLAAMLAAQKENSHPKEPVLGIVSSGMIWYFGRLTEQTLVQDLRPFVLTRLDELFGALKFVFDEASQLAQKPESRP
jgi:hypothetical protein